MDDSIAFYAHVPFCKHACPYCDFYKMELRERPARERLEFPARLAREYALLLEAHPEMAGRPLASLYFGGGTPSVLQPKGVAALIDEIVSNHDATAETEITLEANPENLTPQRCAAWREAGIDRLSIGVQSFAPRDLERLERLHESELIPRVVGNARDAGFGNISIDLMFGLPEQTLDDWMESLARAVELRPDHLSFYGLTIHDNTPFHDEAERGRLPLPDEDTVARMYIEGSALLRENGFEHYEISNFAQPGRRSRHNQRYWSGEDVVGLGPGAHSSCGDLRWWNPDDIDLWKESLAIDELCRSHPERLPERILAEELLFRGLRTREGIALDQSPGALIVRAWIDSVPGRQAGEAGWYDSEGGRLALTLEGWLRSDSILLSMIGLAAR